METPFTKYVPETTKEKHEAKLFELVRAMLQSGAYADLDPRSIYVKAVVFLKLIEES